MLKGCVKTLLVLVACVGLSYVALAGRVPPPRDRFAAVAAGLALWLGWGCVETAGEARKSIAALRAAMAGERPLDGARAAAIGPIHAVSGRPLEAPISGKPCVLYEYAVFTRGGDDAKATLASGFALAPSEVRSPAGSIRLLGYPIATKLPAHVRVAPEDRERAAAYLASTTFEPMGLAEIGKMLATVKELMTDDDGSLRKDMRMKEGVTDLAAYTLEEKLLPEGEVVTVMGRYDAARGGITGDLAGTGRTVSLELGGGDDAIRRFSSDLRSRIVSGIVLIVLLLGGTFGLLEVLERQEGRSLLRPASSSAR